MVRSDGRAIDELRPVKIVREFLKHPEGSVLISTGDTKVICTATVEENVPGWLNGLGQGWVTAEYAMLPRATDTRTNRHKISGRNQEISRLIGRSLRQAVDLTEMGEHTVRIDCDVIQADGGTRTASITGAYVALIDALRYMVENGHLDEKPVLGYVAAISVGLVDGECLLDLSYVEDVAADVDMNIVMRENEFVEVQGTGEGASFGRDSLDTMLSLATKGINELVEKQKDALS